MIVGSWETKSTLIRSQNFRLHFSNNDFEVVRKRRETVRYFVGLQCRDIFTNNDLYLYGTQPCVGDTDHPVTMRKLDICFSLLVTFVEDHKSEI